MTTRKTPGTGTRGRTTRGTASDATGTATPKVAATKTAPAKAAPAETAAETAAEATTAAAETVTETVQAATDTAARTVKATTEAAAEAAPAVTEAAAATPTPASPAPATPAPATPAVPAMKSGAELMEEMAAMAAATTAADIAAEAVRTASAIAERSAKAAMEVFDGVKKSVSSDGMADGTVMLDEANRLRERAVEDLMEASNETAKALSDATDGIIAFTQARIDFGVNTAREAFAAQSFEEMAAVQERYARGLVDLYVEHAAKMSEVGIRLAGAALAPLNRQWQNAFTPPSARPRV
ncbi:phasin family protein [Tistrella mobilis]|uniref:phasin family protein n=1 Tax=Tistrella mobilis TaxID=171437 RepID=UPI0031F61A43